MGTPLVNFMILLPDGGSLFMGVEKAAGVSKDGEWIAEVRLCPASQQCSVWPMYMQEPMYSPMPCCVTCCVAMQVHNKWIEKVEEKMDGGRVSFVIMDNVKANLKAMRLMAGHCPAFG